MLAREGLARVDEYNPTDELRQAEAAAKRERKNVSSHILLRRRNTRLMLLRFADTIDLERLRR